MIGPHVNDWTAQSVADVQTITGASVIKALAPNNSLHVYADQNPDSLRIARQYIPDISMDWRQRCDLLIVTWGALLKDGTVNAIEIPYNEEGEGDDASFRSNFYAQCHASKFLRDKFPDTKIVGGNWGVGHPKLPSEGNDWQVVVDADPSSVFDYLGLHEYAYPTFLPDDNGNPRPITNDGRRAGYWWLRYRFVYQWAKSHGYAMPPLILTEFGIDKDGSNTGWRSTHISAEEYARVLRSVVALMAVDTFFYGCVNFCHGVNDPNWSTYDTAGQKPIVDLYNTSFESQFIQRSSSTLPDGQGQVAPPVPVLKEKVTEFSQWAGDERNEHEPGTWDYYISFIAHMEADAGLPRGVYGLFEAIRGGFPLAMAHSILLDHKDTASGLAAAEAASGLPANRLLCVALVETGNQFFLGGKPIIRFEAGDWLTYGLKGKPDALNNALEYFRVLPGYNPWDAEGQQYLPKLDRFPWVTFQNLGQADAMGSVGPCYQNRQVRLRLGERRRLADTWAELCSGGLHFC